MPQPKKHASNAGRQAAYRTRRAEARTRAGVTIVPQPPGNARRLPEKPGARRWSLLLAQAQRTVERVADEMEAYQDERSDQWQEDERGEAFMQRLEAVQEVIAAFDNIP